MADMSVIIDKLLKSRGITGAKMCQDLGMSKSFMTELRKGRAKSIKLETAQKIASYFGISVDELYGNEETKKDPTAQGGEATKNPSDELELTEGEIAWIKIMRRFPPEQKAVLIEKLLSELDKNP